MDIKKMRSTVINAVSEKSPEILIGFGLAGNITGETINITKIDKVKLTWKCYAPAAVGYCASAACIIGAQSVNAKRNAVLAGAYKL